jgi:hypothetical protein
MLNQGDSRVLPYTVSRPDVSLRSYIEKPCLPLPSLQHARELNKDSRMDHVGSGLYTG